jgi:capsular polysaccharide biosynthesis protein
MKENLERELDIGQLLRALLKNARYIVLITVVVAMVGLALSVLTTKPVYEAKAKMIVNADISSNDISSSQLAASVKLVDTCTAIIGSRTVLVPVIEALNLPDSSGSLASKISIKSVNNTNVMEITVRYGDVQMAKSITEKILEVAPPIIVETLEAGSVKMVEDVYSTEQPISLSISSTVILYTIIGFVLACGLFTALHLLNNTFRSEYDIRQSFDIPVLGVIPAVESCQQKKKKFGGELE